MIDGFANRSHVGILSVTIGDSSMSGILYYYSYLLNIHKKESSPSLPHLMEIYPNNCHVYGPAIQLGSKSYIFCNTKDIKYISLIMRFIIEFGIFIYFPLIV